MLHSHLFLLASGTLSGCFAGGSTTLNLLIICCAAVAFLFILFWGIIRLRSLDIQKRASSERIKEQKENSWHKVYADIMAKWIEFEKGLIDKQDDNNKLEEKKNQIEVVRSMYKTLLNDARKNLSIDPVIDPVNQGPNN